MTDTQGHTNNRLVKMAKTIQDFKAGFSKVIKKHCREVKLAKSRIKNKTKQINKYNSWTRKQKRKPYN